MRSIENLCCQLTVLFPKVLTTSLYCYALYVFQVDIVLRHASWTSFLAGSVDLLLFTYGLYVYFQVVRAGCGSPLDFAELCTQGEASEGNAQPPQFISQRSIQVKSTGSLRYCTKCNCWKPDRTHHCSSCNRCQLKMDHHCPWFATCVGYNNFKFFVQFLLATVLYSGLNLLVAGWDIYKFIHEEKYLDSFIAISVIMLGVLALTMFISVAIFTGITVYFLLHNMSTIEHQEQVRYRNNMELINDSYYSVSQQPTSDNIGNAFDLGWRRNWQEVMGSNWVEWITPTENKYKRMDFYDNKGLYFDVDEEVFAKLQRNTKLQQQLLQQLQGVQSRQ